MLRLRKYGHWYLLAGFALVALIIWQAVFWAESRRGLVFLSVFDVGQGDAILIQAANGNQVLIDGGPDDSVLARLGQVLPFWDRSLDLLILTHPHADHLDGLLEVLKRYQVGVVLESGVNHTIPEYREWRELISARKIPSAIARRGQEIRIGDDLSLEVLAPFKSFAGVSVKNIHEAAVVLRFKFSSTTALLMSDAETGLERKLLAAGGTLESDILKIGHHGSKTSSREEFLAAVRPKLAVISAGRRNRYGHPAQEVLDRLAALGIRIHRTDLTGSINLMSDGRAFQ